MGLARWTFMVFGAIAVFAAAPVFADDWPVRPIVVVSPFASGTTNDVLARTVLNPAES